ncbi:hypothetical protein RB593_000336 [Gaeumannomyces tritici]
MSSTGSTTFERKNSKPIAAACLHPCENALQEAERIGKSPGLCIEPSPYTRHLADCLACLDATLDYATNSLARGHPADELVPYVVYCTKTDAFAPFTGLARQLALGLSKRRPVSTATGLPAMTRAANLNATGWTAVAKAVDLGPSTGEPKSMSKESVDVLANAIMVAPAGAAAVAILAIGAVVFYRRRRRRRKRKRDRPEGGGGDIEDKPQLHSEHLPRVNVQEMDAWQPPGELAGVQPPRLAELPAKEPAATEMAASSDGQR